MKKLLTALALGIAALPLLSASASAHGCHRDVQMDARGWHRHAPDCDRIQAHRDEGGYGYGDWREGRERRDYSDDRERRERREYRERREHRDDEDDRPRCVERCQYVGPIKTCDRVCR